MKLLAAFANIAVLLWGIHRYFKDQPTLTNNAKRMKWITGSLSLFALFICIILVWFSSFSEVSLIFMFVPAMLLFYFASSNQTALELSDYWAARIKIKRRHKKY